MLEDSSPFVCRLVCVCVCMCAVCVCAHHQVVWSISCGHTSDTSKVAKVVQNNIRNERISVKFNVGQFIGLHVIIMAHRRHTHTGEQMSSHNSHAIRVTAGEGKPIQFDLWYLLCAWIGAHVTGFFEASEREPCWAFCTPALSCRRPINTSRAGRNHFQNQSKMFHGILCQQVRFLFYQALGDPCSTTA